MSESGDIRNAIAHTLQGKVKGFVSKNARGIEFYNFLGIPYGKPPLGDLRFKAPVPADPWPGVFDGTKPGNACVQAHYFTKEFTGSEDCLNLNVYTPCLPGRQTVRTALKPVMVYIHGGSFLSGSNTRDLHGPELLVSEDVVLVAINYRLGFFGFLTLDDPRLDVPGNAAFKDMVLALKWVRKNIENFTGDPDNVTIFGNSAGAASVHFLVLSPMAKGLFNRAICQSGTAVSSWSYAYKNAPSLARALGFPDEAANDRKFYDLLKNAPAKRIFEAQQKIDKETVHANRFRFIGVVVESAAWRGEKFFAKHPVEHLLTGDYSKVPLMLGYNSGDGMLLDGMVEPSRNYIYLQDKEHNVPGLLCLEKGSALSRHLGEAIVKFYFGTEEASRETHLKEFYDLTTDNSFLNGVLRSVRHHRRTSKQPLYVYRLSVESDLCFYKRILDVKLPGVCHADEIGYLFTTILTEIPAEGSVEDVAQKRMVRMWTNFAKFSDPTPVRDPLLGVQWEPVSSADRIAYLDIDAELKMDYDPEPERMRFWNGIYSKGKLFSKL